MNLHERTLSVLACRVESRWADQQPVLPRLELLLPITPPPTRPGTSQGYGSLGLHHAPSQPLLCCLASPS